MLGWDFALDMNETAKQIAQEAGLDIKFVRIPREVLEQKAVEQGDIRFFELAALSVDAAVKGRELTITLTDFMVPPDDVPDDVIKAVKHWSEWIDYWAVDFNYRDDTFHNEWQSYRTRKDRSLKLDVRNKYDQPGTYTVLVKVIDILGNDTTKAIEVTIN
ncbi:MAG TPA: PKD domain-containing protein [Bellilinea sp.]|nr:PKD domain-containing protein [Bellilinea sp.]